MTTKVIELPALDVPRLATDTGNKLVRITGAIAALGIIACVVAALMDVNRFAFSYLTGFLFTVTIGLGAMFFVILHHTVKAGWSVAARRHMEWISLILPICAVLFIPIVLMAPTIFGQWWHGPTGHEDPLSAKSAYLNPTFFYIRAAIFFAAWTFLSLWFARQSANQDESGDPRLTVKMQLLAPPMMFVFAFTLTFAGFDWAMSLDPFWYSTIFGVYIFAGAVVSSLSLLAVITILFQRSRILRRVSTVEHRHTIGQLVFAFVVFWSYIGFSQYMLIWYANMPEETVFYRNRWTGSWVGVSLILVFGHFAIPFLYLMSRHVKRHMLGLLAGAIWMLAMHYVDMYWLVMPNLDPAGANPTLIDLAGLLGPAGILAFLVAWKAQKGPLYPVKDPRLIESLTSENH
jgi:hypothetical protein